MKLTIEQLADKVNELISEKLSTNPDSVKDGRQSNILSTRRIRDYMTKGLIEKPVGSGREKWFDQTHVDALVALRMLQHNGLSEKYIFSNSSYQATEYENEAVAEESTENDPDKVMQSNALEFLKSLSQGKARQESSAFGLSGAIGSPAKMSSPSLLSSANSYVAKDTDNELLKSLSQSKYKQFNEYCIEEKLGVYLKVDSKTDLALQRKLMEVLKNEINNYNKENKNG